MQAAVSLDARIQRNHQRLVAFLARRVGPEAEEIAQETWLRVSRAMPDFADEAAFRGYAFTVARRLLVDHYRRRKVRSIVVPIDTSVERHAGAADPQSELTAQRIAAEVSRVLAGMKPEVAEVFHLRTTTDASFKAIAERQGVSLNTALGRHHNATKQIRRALGAAGLIDGENHEL